MLYCADNVIEAELEFFAKSNKCVDTCMNYTRPSLAVLLEPIRKAFLEAKSRGVSLRYLTEITSDNIAAAKELMNIVDELRHFDGIKGNFMVSESPWGSESDMLDQTLLNRIQTVVIVPLEP